MNLHQLEWFCLAYDTRSFAKAAEQAFVSRQAFGKAIKGLEGELGAALFARDAAGVQPTEFAQLLYPKAKTCIGDYRSMLQARDDYLVDKRQHLRLAFAYGVATALPEDFLERLEDANPHAEHLVEKHSAVHCLELLERGEVDFVICSGASNDCNLLRIPLISYPTYVAVARHLVTFPIEHCTIEDLQTLTFLTLGDDMPEDRALEALFASHGMALRANRQYRDYDVILREVKRGHGASIVPENCLDQVAEDHVALIPFPDESFSWQLDFLYPNRSYSDIEQRTIQFMREHSRMTRAGASERIIP